MSDIDKLTKAINNIGKYKYCEDCFYFNGSACGKGPEPISVAPTFGCYEWTAKQSETPGCGIVMNSNNSHQRQCDDFWHEVITLGF